MAGWATGLGAAGAIAGFGAALATAGFGARGWLGRALGRRVGRDGVARPERPRRWTFPITALRVTPPSCFAI
jgi:hypothetical protein